VVAVVAEQMQETQVLARVVVVAVRAPRLLEHTRPQKWEPLQLMQLVRQGRQEPQQEPTVQQAATVHLTQQEQEPH
jgi:hypothetical protein